MLVTKRSENQYDTNAFNDGRITFKNKIPGGDGNNFVETECYNGYWRINMLFAYGKRASINLCLAGNDKLADTRRAEMLHENTVALAKQEKTFDEIEEVITRLERNGE